MPSSLATRIFSAQAPWAAVHIITEARIKRLEAELARVTKERAKALQPILKKAESVANVEYTVQLDGNLVVFVGTGGPSSMAYAEKLQADARKIGHDIYPVALQIAAARSYLLEVLDRAMAICVTLVRSHIQKGGPANIQEAHEFGWMLKKVQWADPWQDGQELPYLVPATGESELPAGFRVRQLDDSSL